MGVKDEWIAMLHKRNLRTSFWIYEQEKSMIRCCEQKMTKHSLKRKIEATSGMKSRMRQGGKRI